MVSKKIFYFSEDLVKLVLKPVPQSICKWLTLFDPYYDCKWLGLRNIQVQHNHHSYLVLQYTVLIEKTMDEINSIQFHCRTRNRLGSFKCIWQKMHPDVNYTIPYGPYLNLRYSPVESLQTETQVEKFYRMWCYWTVKYISWKCLYLVGLCKIHSGRRHCRHILDRIQESRHHFSKLRLVLPALYLFIGIQNWVMKTNK